QRVREGRGPDVDVDAAVELRQRARLSVVPLALAVALQLERARVVLRRHAEPRVTHAPRGVPGEAIGEAEGPPVLVDGDHEAVGGSGALLARRGAPRPCSSSRLRARPLAGVTLFGPAGPRPDARAATVLAGLLRHALDARPLRIGDGHHRQPRDADQWGILEG